MDISLMNLKLPLLCPINRRHLSALDLLSKWWIWFTWWLQIEIQKMLTQCPLNPIDFKHVIEYIDVIEFYFDEQVNVLHKTQSQLLFTIGYLERNSLRYTDTM